MCATAQSRGRMWKKAYLFVSFFFYINCMFFTPKSAGFQNSTHGSVNVFAGDRAEQIRGDRERAGEKTLMGRGCCRLKRCIQMALSWQSKEKIYGPGALYCCKQCRVK